MKHFNTLLVLAILLTASAGFAGGARNDISEVGEHYPIFTFEKNMNPQNIMAIYTKLDRACNVLPSEEFQGQPTFDFYWLMDRQNYKPVNGMIKNGIRDRLELQNLEDPAQARTAFYVKVNDLKEMEHDLTDPRLLVKATSDTQTGKCIVDGYLTLGPSDGNVTIRLDMIYTKASGILRPKPEEITVNGINIQNGQKVSRTYKAK